MPDEIPVGETITADVSHNTPRIALEAPGSEMPPRTETVMESAQERVQETVPTKPQPAPPPVDATHQVQRAVAAPPVIKDQVAQEVEQILASGLEPFYASLPPEGKTLFRHKGEQASQEISAMVRQLSVQVKRVLELIYHWLKIIPGVNKFFLEQEAKIKTDQIIQYTEDLRKRRESGHG